MNPSQTAQLTVIAVNAWKQVTGRIDEVVISGAAGDFEQTVAPGRNRVIYIVGHLTAIHDRLFTLLRIGERLHPELDAEFLDNADAHAAGTSVADVRKAWTEVMSKLTPAIEALPPLAWLEKHSAVSDDDFQKDPLRNRLAVLVSRTNHAAYHRGQINLTR